MKRFRGKSGKIYLQILFISCGKYEYAVYRCEPFKMENYLEHVSKEQALEDFESTEVETGYEYIIKIANRQRKVITDSEGKILIPNIQGYSDFTDYYKKLKSKYGDESVKLEKKKIDVNELLQRAS